MTLHGRAFSPRAIALIGWRRLLRVWRTRSRGSRRGVSSKGGGEGPHLHLLHSTMSRSSTYKQNSLPRSWHTLVLKVRGEISRQVANIGESAMSVRRVDGAGGAWRSSATSGAGTSAGPLCRSVSRGRRDLSRPGRLQCPPIRFRIHG